MIISNSRISLFSNIQKPNMILYNKNPSPAPMFFSSESGKDVTTRNYSLKVLPKNDSSFPISDIKGAAQCTKFPLCAGFGEEPNYKGLSYAALTCNSAISDVKNKKNKVYDNEEAKLADKWEDIHGRNDWKGMLDPIDPLLRAELIRYGEMAQACYDAFDLDQDSKFCGSCKIDPELFFQSLGWSTNHGYNVTSYIYSMYHINVPSFFKLPLWPDAWSHKANWIGYIAVSNDEYSTHLGRRDITIAWRGTVTDLEKIADFMDFQKPTRYHKIPSRDPTIKVEAGFLEIYTSKDDECNFCKVSAREQVLAEVKRLINRYSNEEISITITGHSLGSALAIINGYDIAEIGLDVREDGRVIPICVFSFSGPRVGNIRFKQRLEGLGVKVLRVVNKHDKVPAVPGIFLNENVPTFVQKIGELFLPWCYLHVGEELVLDHKTSPFLKDVDNLTYFHNLEVHLHLLDGFHGKGRRFWLASSRDKTLVNKTTDFLKDDLLVPPNWWETEYRKLIKHHKGQWMIDPQQVCLKNHSPEEDVHHHLGLTNLKFVRVDKTHSSKVMLSMSVKVFLAGLVFMIAVSYFSFYRNF